MSTAKFCASCGSPLTAGECPQCGASRTKLCRSCGVPNAMQNRFCASCGAEQGAVADDKALRLLIPANAADDAIAATETERREVTVLFVDASNFTAVSKRLDSEDVYLFIDEAMALLVDVVSEYDGTIDKFTGDGLMALFGAPIAHENDPERAVRAAWEMQRVIAPFRERLVAQHGFEFRIRIGVHTGEVVAGKIGSRLHAEYTVIGDTVNLASRLQTAAEPDTVCVSEATHAMTANLFRYEQLPPLTLKGMPEPVTAYRLAGVRARGISRRGLPGVVVPLVGRDAALRRLIWEFDTLRATRRQRVIAITGEAGLGKTRLVSEFLHSVREPEARAVVVAGSAASSSRPLGIVTDIARALLAIDENDPPAAQNEAVRAAVQRFHLDPAGDAPPLLNLLGAAHEDEDALQRLAMLDDAMLQQQTFAAVRSLLVAAAATPLVLIADDMHWTDAASRDFIRYAVQSTPDVAMMIVPIAREEATVRPVLDVAAEKNPHVIGLQPLDRSHSKLLLQTLIPGGEMEVRQLRKRIGARAEGNPLFAEELVRMLLDRGILARNGNSFRVVASGTDVLRDIPPTLRGLILARFDCLPRNVRQMLQQISVLGRTFPARLLVQLTGDDEGVADALDVLVKRQFLREESFGLEKGYAFSHALIQEAIHSTILKRDRQELHGRVARVIASGEFPSRLDRDELLAYHWAESGTPEAAIPHLVAVAEGAARRHANETAVDHCRRALAILESAPDREAYVRIQLVHGRALKFLGKLSDASAQLQRAMDVLYADIAADEAPNSPRVLTLAELLRELADAEARGGHLAGASKRLDEAIVLLAARGDDEAVSMRYALAERMAWVRFRQGRLDEALITADGVVRDLEQSENADPAVLASLYNTLGGISWNFGKLDVAASYVRRSLALYKKVGYLFGKANAYTNLGVLYHAQGRWKEAADSYERSDFIRREIGYLVGRASNLKNLAYLRIAMGNHRQARVELETSLNVSRHLGEDSDALRAMMALAHLAVIESRFDDADALLTDIRAKDLSSLGADDLALVTCDEAMVAAHRRSPADGLQLAMNALDAARASGVRSTEADCCRVVGVLHARAGDCDAGEEALRKSLSLANDIGDPYRTGLTLLELGRAAKSAAERRKSLEEAARIFTEIGAEYDQDQAIEALQAMRVA